MLVNPRAAVDTHTVVVSLGKILAFLGFDTTTSLVLLHFLFPQNVVYNQKLKNKTIYIKHVLGWIFLLNAKETHFISVAYR